MPVISKQKSNPGFNLALSGGGVRACVHVGFYEVLREQGIPITGVAGTSMGAIIGAAIALGYSSETIRKFFIKYRDFNMVSLRNFNFFNESLLKRDTLTTILDEFFGASTFADTKIPFACSAVDLESRKEIVFRKGSIARAVEASAAYPLLFPPLFHQSHYMIDGGILDEVPAVLARSLTSDPLIAIRVKNNVVRQYISGQIYMKYYQHTQKMGIIDAMKNIFKRKRFDFRLMLDIVLESITIASELNVQKILEEAKPDILLEPVVDIGLLDFAKIDEAIELGRKMAVKALPQIKVFSL